MGQFGMPLFDNPFRVIEKVVDKYKGYTIFIDFHAESTAEKMILFELLQCKVSAICGTHTHVSTDDMQIKNGTFYITDIGLTGCRDGIIGMDTKNPIIKATTGLNDHQKNLMIEASKKAPILYATNMSLGVAILNKLVALVSEKLRDFDIEIVEQHHHFKVDAPSGTALTLAESCAKARNLELKEVMITGRSGHVGARSKDEIGVFAIRGGDVVGRHTVGFYNEGEFLELNHTATSRETFARGAIKVSKWLINQSAGLYSINDALGI